MIAPVVTASPTASVRFDRVDPPALSVVIVTYGTGRVVERCITDLARALEADRLDAEVIVVDNLHPERGHATADHLSLWTSGVRMLRADVNHGFGGGNNVGVRLARADRVCLLNPDVFVAPGQLARLVAAADDRPDDIVAPALVNVDGSLQEIGYRFLANGETRAVLDPARHRADYASAACWVLARSVFDELGGFDEVYHPAYYEDSDFALRAKAAGHDTVIVDDVRVIHAHRSRSHTRRPAPVPDVSRQRAIFAERWADVLADRPVD